MKTVEMPYHNNKRPAPAFKIRLMFKKFRIIVKDLFNLMFKGKDSF